MKLLSSDLGGLLKPTERQRIGRYLIVGGLNTIVIIGAYQLALLVLNWEWWIASFFCSIVGIGIGFKAHGTLVFQKQGYFWRYLLNWAINFTINTAAIGLVRDWTGDALAPIVLLPLTTISSYMILKYLVFIK